MDQHVGWTDIHRLFSTHIANIPPTPYAGLISGKMMRIHNMYAKSCAC